MSTTPFVAIYEGFPSITWSAYSDATTILDGIRQYQLYIASAVDLPQSYSMRFVRSEEAILELLGKISDLDNDGAIQRLLIAQKDLKVRKGYIDPNASMTAEVNSLINRLQTELDTISKLTLDVAKWKHENPESLKKRKGNFPLTYKERTFRYRRKDYPIKGNPCYATLCDVFYANCPKLGKIDIEKMKELLRKTRKDFDNVDESQIRDTIKSLNRWAKYPHNFGDGFEILDVKAGYVVRLK